MKKHFPPFMQFHFWDLIIIFTSLGYECFINLLLNFVNKNSLWEVFLPLCKSHEIRVNNYRVNKIFFFFLTGNRRNLLKVYTNYHIENSNRHRLIVGTLFHIFAMPAIKWHIHFVDCSLIYADFQRLFVFLRLLNLAPILFQVVLV